MRRDINLEDKIEAQNNDDRGRWLNRSLRDGNDREFPAQLLFYFYYYSVIMFYIALMYALTSPQKAT